MHSNSESNPYTQQQIRNVRIPLLIWVMRLLSVDKQYRLLDFTMQLKQKFKSPIQCTDPHLYPFVIYGADYFVKNLLKGYGLNHVECNFVREEDSIYLEICGYQLFQNSRRYFDVEELNTFLQTLCENLNSVYLECITPNIELAAMKVPLLGKYGQVLREYVAFGTCFESHLGHPHVHARCHFDEPTNHVCYTFTYGCETIAPMQLPAACKYTSDRQKTCRPRKRYKKAVASTSTLENTLPFVELPTSSNKAPEPQLIDEMQPTLFDTFPFDFCHNDSVIVNFEDILKENQPNCFDLVGFLDQSNI